MCAIIDANIVGEIFNQNRPPAAQKFLDWVNNGPGRIVAGGWLLVELDKNSAFKEWRIVAERYGKLRRVNSDEVNIRGDQLKDSGSCKSDDPHVVALAQISGARLLYSNDTNLHKDFKAKGLIDNPRGSIYSTIVHKDFHSSHKRNLGNKDLCRI